MVGLVVGGIIFGSVTLAPNYTPVDHYVAAWEAEVQEVGLTNRLINEYLSVLDTMPGSWWLPEMAFEVKPAAQVTSFPQGVEQWRSLVELHFYPEDVRWAMRVMQCESQGNTYAKNPTSSASGLFQFLRGWFSGSWGYPAFDPFNPEANVKAAAWLYYTEGPQHWVCK